MTYEMMAEPIFVRRHSRCSWTFRKFPHTSIDLATNIKNRVQGASGQGAADQVKTTNEYPPWLEDPTEGQRETPVNVGQDRTCSSPVHDDNCTSGFTEKDISSESQTDEGGLDEVRLESHMSKDAVERAR
jgi:hypothetical protein